MINIFKRAWAHFFRTVKWFHLFLQLDVITSISNNSVKHKYTEMSSSSIYPIERNLTTTTTPRVELGAMAIKGYSAFPKAPALLKPHH